MADEAVVRIVVQDEGSLADETRESPDHVSQPSQYQSAPPPNRASTIQQPPAATAPRSAQPQPFDATAEAQKRYEAEVRREQINLAYEHLYDTTKKTESTFDAILGAATKLRGTLGGAFGPLVGSILDVLSAIADARKDTAKSPARVEAERRNAQAQQQPVSAQPISQPYERSQPVVTPVVNVDVDVPQPATVAPSTRSPQTQASSETVSSHAVSSATQQSKQVLDEAAEALRAVGHTQTDADHMLRTLMQQTTRTFGTVQEVLQAIYAKPKQSEPGTAKSTKELHLAAGGVVPHAPGVLSTEDEVPIRATAGEYVINKNAATRPENKKILEKMNRGESVRDGHYEEGGEIDYGVWNDEFGEAKYSRSVSQTDKIFEKVVKKKLAEVTHGEAWPFPPVDVRRENGPYDLKDGHHRIEVAKRLGMKVIPATLIDHRAFGHTKPVNTFVEISNDGKLRVVQPNNENLPPIKVMSPGYATGGEIKPDYAANLAAIPPSELHYVGGLPVRRESESSFRIDTDDGHVTGDVSVIQSHIEQDQQKRLLHGKKRTQAIDRMAGVSEPDIFSDPQQYEDDARGFAGLRKGVKVVSLHPDTHGRVGSIERDESGRNRVKLEGTPGYASEHVEPLNPKLSWRTSQEKTQTHSASLFDAIEQPEESKPVRKQVADISYQGTSSAKRELAGDITEDTANFFAAEPEQTRLFADGGEIGPDYTSTVPKSDLKSYVWGKTKTIASSVASAPKGLKDWSMDRYGPKTLGLAGTVAQGVSYAASVAAAPIWPYGTWGLGPLLTLPTAELIHRMRDPKTIEKEKEQYQQELIQRAEHEEGVLQNFAELPNFAESGASHYATGGIISSRVRIQKDNKSGSQDLFVNDNLVGGMNISDPSQSEARTARNMFPLIQMNEASKVSRIGGVDIDDEYQGIGLGQMLYLRSFDKSGADWHYNSQTFPPATNTLKAMQDKGWIELHWRGREPDYDEEGGIHLARITPEGRDAYRDLAPIHKEKLVDRFPANAPHKAEGGPVNDEWYMQPDLPIAEDEPEDYLPISDFDELYREQQEEENLPLALPQTEIRQQASDWGESLLGMACGGRVRHYKGGGDVEQDPHEAFMRTAYPSVFKPQRLPEDFTTKGVMRYKGVGWYDAERDHEEELFGTGITPVQNPAETFYNVGGEYFRELADAKKFVRDSEEYLPAYKPINTPMDIQPNTDATRFAEGGTIKIKKKPDIIYRGEGDNLGFSGTSSGQWWSRRKDIAAQYGDVKESEIDPKAKVLDLTRKSGKRNKKSFSELARVAKKYNIDFDPKQEDSGEEFFAANNSELLDAVITEGYQVVHTDNIEGPASIVLDQSALRSRIHKATGGTIPPAPGIESTADEVPIRATAGEYIVNRVASMKPENKKVLEYINKGGHFAEGGQVGQRQERADSILGRERMPPQELKSEPWALEQTQKDVLASINQKWQNAPASSASLASSVADSIPPLNDVSGKKPVSTAGDVAPVGYSKGKQVENTANLVGKFAPQGGAFAGAASSVAAAAGPIGIGLAIGEIINKTGQSAVRGATAPFIAAASTDTNPAVIINAAGEALKSVIPIAGEMVTSFAALMNAIDGTAKRYGEFSPQIAQAQAMAEVNHTMGEIRRAQESGPELARFVQMQGRLQEKFEDIKIKVLMKILPLVEAIGDAIEGLMPTANAMEGSAGQLANIATGVGVLGSVGQMIANLMADQTNIDAADPTDMITQNPAPFGSVPSPGQQGVQTPPF